MAVFTPVSAEQLAVWLRNYSLGALIDLRGISAGIENTNYSVVTTQGQFVLTLFERLGRAELEIYLNFMAHLADHGIACPRPMANLSDGYLSDLNAKPATIVTKLEGASVLNPSGAHCAEVGRVLASMHLAAQSFPARLPNPRGNHWWAATAPQLNPFLSAAQSRLLQSELDHQAGVSWADVARGLVHADLFRDNVLWIGPRIGGVLDFYFAGVDSWLYDLAVTANDWCTKDDASLDQSKLAALIGAYHQARPVSAAERAAWPNALRAAALRFWLSRLDDFHRPRPGHLIQAHDPARFQRILERHVAAPPNWPLTAT